jgi:hypothetical protein
VTETRPAFPYETAHERDTVGLRHMTIISVARDGRAYVYGEFYKFKIEPGPQAQEDQCLW